MNIELIGKRALICGGSQGIGLATARTLAGLGADVTLLARGEQRLRKIVDALPSNRGQTHNWIAADISDTDTLFRKVQERLDQWPVQLLINNSGGPSPAPLHGAAVADFEAAWRQHLVANHVLAAALIPGMELAGYGRIVNVISTSVKEPIPGLGVSNVTRWAVASWAKTLATELAPKGITVNNVLPGSTDTPRIRQIIESTAARTGRSQDEVAEKMRTDIPMRRFADPLEIAAAVAFLCSPAASYITGINLPVDGGRTRSL